MDVGIGIEIETKTLELKGMYMVMRIKEGVLFIFNRKRASAQKDNLILQFSEFPQSRFKTEKIRIKFNEFSAWRTISDLCSIPISRISSVFLAWCNNCNWCEDYDVKRLRQKQWNLLEKSCREKWSSSNRIESYNTWHFNIFSIKFSIKEKQTNRTEKTSGTTLQI